MPKKKIGKKRGPQKRKNMTSTHVSGGKGVRVQRSGKFEWEKVGRKGTFLKGGKVATSAAGKKSKLHGPEGDRSIKPGSLAVVGTPKSKNKKKTPRRRKK